MQIDQQLGKLGQATVLCIGDLMLDDFVYGEVSRISPEAPAPVLAVTRSELVIGGGGNVARNLASLGTRCIFVGVVGEDDAGSKLTLALAGEPMIEPHLVVDSGRPTTRKVRFVSEHFSTHLLRADWELARPIGVSTEQDVIDRVLVLLPDVACVVLSDYAKGVLTPRVIRTVIEAARAFGKPVVVDPKGKDFSVYRDATLITPNRHELADATRRPAVTDAEIVAAATELNRIVGSKAVLVTRSEEGMTFVPAAGEPLHLPAHPVRVRDVSGAGDTVVAVLAAMLAAQSELELAVRAANAAAAVVVGKRGTASVSVAELHARLLPPASLAAAEKIIFDWSVLDERLDEWRRRGLRIGFTNGCFDLVHRGHVKLLTQARAVCDRLVVGLNDDASVRRLKGESRPIQDVHARAEILAALEAVDLVAVFGDDTPLKLLERVRPRALVKGNDYRREEVVGHELVEANGGETVLVDLLPGHSTTALVGRSAASSAPSRQGAERVPAGAAEPLGRASKV
ncbi:MAG: D-glycero-beta-D-manno-heptose-7-phosphate kinase [Acetobacteraceae bacterium]|nr:D-glycero-beta-D-manno-heptose-7-phosphate kinase [Acetobacteraceae bacterium]